MEKGERAQRGEENTTIDINGDLLEAILSHLPLIHLLAAYHVSQNWRYAVQSSLSNPSRIKPWLIAYVQNSRNPSMVTTCAYDPESRVWIDIPRTTMPLRYSPILSSHSNLIYMHTPSKLAFSVDPLSSTWHEVDGPKVWRSDPIVALIGSHVVIAGGSHDFELDPLAVEIYDARARTWKTCQPMPDILKVCAATTWLSVAASDLKMYLIEKNSATFCSFDPNTRTWGDTLELRPNGSIFFSLIAFSKNRLVLIGLTGDMENVESLRIWEVNSETFDCNEIGKMPSIMLGGLIDPCSSPSSINISMADNLVYVYNLSNLKVIVYCELSDCSCNWGSIQNSAITDQNQLHRFTFTCSKVGIHDLLKAFGSGKRR
ncbi:hypothetical protein IFM89_011631 [Coptis chinensis]|uniref:F-box domain-containing protein n=1 Tax=Coptis chinensis TaxID=261450 RepID=A0A835M9G0_9MAGN|nr:hypothetical protein IFM89_011631 [Coptis chinensis]